MSSAIAPIRTAGVATGLALAVLLVLAFRVPASSQALGAGIRIEADAPGEVHVPTGEAFLSARRLVPGGRATRAELPVRNVTRGPIHVRVRAREGGRELDGALRVELRSEGRRLASGTLGELRRWSRPVLVERGAERTVHARAWIPAGAPGTEGRRVAVALQLDADLADGNRR